MKDYQSFLDSLSENSQSMRSDFSKSLCLALDKFYDQISAIYVSSLTTEGLDEIDSFLPNLEIQFEELQKEVKSEINQK